MNVVEPVTPIALVVSGLDGGGLERAVRDLALGLVRRGHAPAVFCMTQLGRYFKELPTLGVPTFDCRETGARIPAVPIRLLRALRDHRPQLLHAHSGTWLPATVARLLLRIPGFIFTDHGRYPEPAHRALVERWCCRHTDRLVTVSEELAEFDMHHLRLRAPATVIPNGVDLSAFAVTDPDRRAARRAEWRVAPDEVVLIAVGRLMAVKNHALLFRAVARARAAGARLRVVLAGDGHLEDALRADAAQLGIAHAVQFLGFRSDTPACLEAADVFVLSSDSEGLPLSLLEAMAAGLPTVSTNVGGIAAALGTPAAGLLVPPGDEEALAAALGRMAQDVALRERCGHMARERAQAYSLDRMCDTYVRLYADVSRQ